MYAFYKSRDIPLICIFIVLLICLLHSESRGERATMEEAMNVGQNWLAYVVSEKGQWAGVTDPLIEDGYEIVENDMTLGYFFPVSPRGYIVVPVLKELPPIKAYSDEHDLDIEKPYGFAALVREVLQHRIRLYVRIYGSLDALQPSTGDVLLGREHRAAWSRFQKAKKQFRDEIDQTRLLPMREVQPLLTSSWDQGDPYNDLCPMGDNSDRCVVGCVATATGQIMNYWEWPPYGNTGNSYTWDGDDSCDSTHSVGAGTVLSAVFHDDYDWSNMPDDCGSCSSDEEDAVAELCYEVGIAYEMDYGSCGSSVSTDHAVTVLPTFFWYDNTIAKEDRNDFTTDQWASHIRAELNDGRPILYRIFNHAIVCDGWQSSSGGNQYHMNYGWDDGHTDWYDIDDLHCPWVGCGVTEEYMIIGIQPLDHTLICGEIYDGNGGPLTAAGSTYLATCNIVVPSGQTLTIDPGVTVYFESGCKIIANGTLNADGLTGNPTYLLSSDAPHNGVEVISELRLENGGVIKPR